MLVRLSQNLLNTFTSNSIFTRLKYKRFVLIFICLMVNYYDWQQEKLHMNPRLSLLLVIVILLACIFCIHAISASMSCKKFALDVDTSLQTQIQWSNLTIKVSLKLKFPIKWCNPAQPIIHQSELHNSFTQTTI